MLIKVVEESAVGRAAQRHGRSGYEHLAPLFTEKAQLGPEDPRQALLRERLIEGHLPLAEHLARRFAGRGEPLDDLAQVTTVGLIKAVDRFDPARGSHFLSFAVPTIVGEICRYFRDQDRRPAGTTHLGGDRGAPRRGSPHKLVSR
ncbi:MAG: sigma-70 family RNA polymerase sigma factor [Pseudonocardiaceae bacterium]